jgi:anti-sigma regulatory factor (Ser/Thr protein kinase)
MPSHSTSISVTDALRGVLDPAEKYCLRGGVPIEVAADVRLALEEILANLIVYAWPGGGQHEPGAWRRNFRVGREAAFK